MIAVYIQFTVNTIIPFHRKELSDGAPNTMRNTKGRWHDQPDLDQMFSGHLSKPALVKSRVLFNKQISQNIT